MKANEAPEKLYVDSEDRLSDSILYGFTQKRKDNDIEYVRADAFIEKACKWFKNNWREYVNTDKDGVVCFGHWENDFRNYMKGE